MKATFEEDGPRDLRSERRDELQDLLAAFGARHKRQPSALPAFQRQALVTGAPLAKQTGRRSHGRWRRWDSVHLRGEGELGEAGGGELWGGGWRLSA